MTQYHLYDAGMGGGHFTSSGVTQAEQTVLTFNDLANVNYAGAATPSRETLYVQVNDEEAWSDRKRCTESTSLLPTNSAPVVSGPAVKNTVTSTWNLLSSFLSVTDG